MNDLDASATCHDPDDSSTHQFETPYEHRHPLHALFAALNIERRTNKNRPYHLLRFTLFLAPSAVLFGLGSVLLPREFAFTVAGSLLGIQLAAPHRKARSFVIGFLDEARDSRMEPIQFGRCIASTMASRPYVGRAATLVRARRLERRWRRYFIDLDGRCFFSRLGNMDPASDPRAYYDHRRRMRLPAVRRWYIRRAVRTLQAAGDLLASQWASVPAQHWEAPDLPARTLAAHWGFPYRTPTPRRTWFTYTSLSIGIPRSTLTESL
jgi:hypothetical protein